MYTKDELSSYNFMYFNEFSGLAKILDNYSVLEQLEILKSQLDKCNSMNDGVTSTIRSNAQAQYQEYQNWLEAQRNQ